MKEWLTYLASDQLQGRQIFTEGFGLAAQYVADHLKAMGRETARDRWNIFSAREIERLSSDAQLHRDG